MTPAQQIALASVIASGSVGLAAVLVTGFSGWRDRVHARTLAHTGRQQERLERTYLELLAYVHHRRVEANAIRPFLGPVPTPRGTTEDEIARIQSLVMAHASKAVRDLLDEFGEALKEIINADIAVQGIENQERQTGNRVDPKEWGGSGADYLKRIQEDKDRLSRIEDRIHVQVSKELSAL